MKLPLFITSIATLIFASPSFAAVHCQAGCYGYSISTNLHVLNCVVDTPISYTPGYASGFGLTEMVTSYTQDEIVKVLRNTICGHSGIGIDFGCKDLVLRIGNTTRPATTFGFSTQPLPFNSVTGQCS